MCGITGLIHFDAKSIKDGIIESMNRAISHRGPDDEGYYKAPGVALGHRRLSIIDLSGGHQPMTTPDARYTIVFNGEIYNYRELKKEIENDGHVFLTHSDTEVLLQLFVREGLECVKKLNGMFAFAVWDARERVLHAARDRMGKKPFYYWAFPGGIAFASELKAIIKHPDFNKRISREALWHYFQYEYVPAPYSIFEGIKKLPQAHTISMSIAGVSIKPYWDIPLGSKLGLSEDELCEKLVGILDRSVERRLMSDVPLGVFLSGGIDSSAVVAMMARHREGRNIKTFSIGFEEQSYDETPYADLIAKTFVTDHRKETLSAKRMLEILPDVLNSLDEPFADYSILPTYLLSAFTRKHVTVALGGDGGDELFAGYPTFLADRYADYLKPQSLIPWFEKMASLLPASDKDMSFEFKLKQFLYGASSDPVLRNQVWLGAFKQQELMSLFSGDVRHLPDPLDLVRQKLLSRHNESRGDQIGYFYQKFYLCDDILVKTDRASMANSLEVRAPFLDTEMVEFAAQVPFEFKLKGKETKYLLKKALQGIVPDDILYRPKKGFGIPLAAWLKKDLKAEVERVLEPNKIGREGLFNPKEVSRIVAEHMAGKRNNRKQIFTLLMFEWWRERYFDCV